MGGRFQPFRIDDLEIGGPDLSQMEPTDRLDAPDRGLPESRVKRSAKRRSAIRPSSSFLVNPRFQSLPRSTVWLLLALESPVWEMAGTILGAPCGGYARSNDIALDRLTLRVIGRVLSTLAIIRESSSGLNLRRVDQDQFNSPLSAQLSRPVDDCRPPLCNPAGPLTAATLRLIMI